MSENIFKPLVNSLFDISKEATNLIYKALGLNSYDFKIFFKKVGVKNKDGDYPIFIKFRDDECFDIYEFILPPGLSLSSIKNKHEEIAQFLKVDDENIRFERRGSNIAIKIIKKVPDVIYNPSIHKMKGYKIPIGIELSTLKIRYWDLSDAGNSHCYIAGGTRCGKSTLLRLIICQLVSKSIRDVTLDLLNEKRVDLIEFKECKNILNYTEDTEEAYDILKLVIKDIENRYKIFSKYKGIKNIWDYRNKVEKIPIRIVVIEELSSYIDNKDFHKCITNIASRGAAAGIFLIITTQLPNKDSLPNLTKQNINTVFGGKCKDSIRSDIIVDGGELHKLKGKGHMKVFDSDEYGTEIQVFWIDDDMVDNIAQNNLKISFRKNKRVLDAGTSKTLGNNKRR